MKGIILAGGEGTRLFPVTSAVRKQLLPVYDKPMIYYPLSVLMVAGIRDILVIATPRSSPDFRHLLGDGSQWGLALRHAVQPSPDGIAQAFLIGHEFIGDDPCALALGDNVFHGHGLTEKLRSAGTRRTGATIFGYQVLDPHRLSFRRGRLRRARTRDLHRREAREAVLSLGRDRALLLRQRRSPDRRGHRAEARGELEITDVNRRYLERGNLHVERLGRGFAWFDTGTHDNLVEAAGFVRTLENRQNQRIAVPEEIAFQNGWISCDELAALGKRMAGNRYREYLLRLAGDIDG